MSDKDDDDGLFDENNNDSSDEEIAVSKNKKKPSKKRKISSGGGDAANAKASKKPTKQSWIDDAAEESGEEGGGSDDDEEEDDDENENDYVKDGFVVDEDEVERVRKKKSGDLEDSDDDEDNDDDDDDDDGPAARKKRFKKSRVRKMRTLDRLAEEDLDLIREARGDKDREESVVREREEARRKAMARNDAELRKGLFYDSGEEDATAAAVAKPRKNVPERYDEDGMDDFIDDDIGDQGQILANDRRAAYDEEKGGVSEAQLNEASEIFGTDYLDFMAQEGHDDGDQEEENLFGKGKYRERGVGVDLGVDSEEDISDDDEDDDDDDLFGDDDADGVSSHQKAEALKLKRQKKEMSRQERRRKAQLEKNSKRKAQLRRAFEPVQLVENFCTDRDDEIRRLDAPERFFDWTTPFHGASGEEISEEEEEQAFWIMGKIPDIASEYFSVSDEEGLEVLEQRQKSITDSIVHALRYMHNEKLEPAFIKRYRKDVVASPSVRENIYNIMDEDGEWDRMISARTKVESVLTTIAASVQGDEAVGAETESLKTLEANLKTAQAKLEESAAQESEIKIEMEELGPADDDAMDEDDDDELFGDDDEDEVSIMFLLFTLF
jgi:transcription elongation factor SPT6